MRTAVIVLLALVCGVPVAGAQDPGSPRFAEIAWQGPVYVYSPGWTLVQSAGDGEHVTHLFYDRETGAMRLVRDSFWGAEIARSPLYHVDTGWTHVTLSFVERRDTIVGGGVARTRRLLVLFYRADTGVRTTLTFDLPGSTGNAYQEVGR